MTIREHHVIYFSSISASPIVSHSWLFARSNVREARLKWLDETGAPQSFHQ
jgi:hypothetical protein